jgi:cell volume regulation protein A
VTSFGWIVLGVSVVVVAAIVSSRLSDWIRIPAPVLFLLGAAVASDRFPALGSMRITGCGSGECEILLPAAHRAA